LSIYKGEKYKLRYFLLAVGTAFLSLSSIRSFSFFIICGIISLSNFFKNYKIPESMIKNDTKTLFIRKILIILIAFAVVLGIAYKNEMIEDGRHNELISVVDFLDSLEKGNLILYSGFNEGGYIEFRGFKTYIDPRAEVFLKSNNKKEDIMNEYIQMLNGEVYYKNVLNKYNFTHLIVSDSDILYKYLDYDNEYQLIYSTSHYKIYEHND
jgi:amino acid transporter